MSKLRLSYSSLQFYFERGCPYAWKLRQEMRPKAINPFALTGILVHQILAGERELVPEEKTEAMYVEKLTNLVKVAGITILEREVWREPMTIIPGVEWVAKLDLIGQDRNGRAIIGDWKTTGNGWKHPLDGSTSPVARSFQGSGYLTRPKGKKWPRTLLYIIAGFRGPGEIIRYDYNRKDDDNLKEAIQVVKAQKKFPKVYGKHCLGTKPDGSDGCEFFTACFKTKGWQDDYTKREDV